MRADLESCRSGRTGRIRNPLYPQGYPGFESLALRQMKKTQPRLGFFVSGEPAERTPFDRSLERPWSPIRSTPDIAADCGFARFRYSAVHLPLSIGPAHAPYQSPDSSCCDMVACQA